MSEGKKNIEQEFDNLSQEKLGQVAGGDDGVEFFRKRIRPCPHCKSERYYSYTVTRTDGTKVRCYRCPDCNYTTHD